MSPIYYLQYFVFSFCVNSFILLTYSIYYGNLLYSTLKNDCSEEYDFVIVGSGTAGSTIAYRMALETKHSFIVIEAGGSSQSLLDIPVLGPLLHGSVYDWQYETVPQENACFAMVNSKCKFPQGKIVGGSSKLNNMIHVRGNTSHYVNWFHGKHTAQYINRNFEFLEKNVFYLDNLNYETELSYAMLAAAKELGYNILDKDSEFSQGFMKSRVTQRRGKRWTASDNLDFFKHIFSNAFVEKVLTRNNRAYGVKVKHSGVVKTIFAKKGVIVSAGTYNTPKILQLSGIGPKEILEPLGIPVVKDLPVGKNLQDHVATGLDLILFNASLSMGPIDMMNMINVLQYFIKGKGPLTSPGCEVLGFLSTKNDTTPDLQFMVLPVGIASDRDTHLRKSIGIKDSVWHNYFTKTYDKHSSTILPIILHPKSKGTVYIHSTNPKDPPYIDPNFLSEKEDLLTIIRGLKLILKFVDTDAMKALGARLNPIPFPGCQKHVIFSDAYWECYVKHLTLSTYHPVGTCSMGLPTSKKSVVDTSFKVLGIDNLFIADGSVLPTLPSGNINAAIAMMASVLFETNILNYQGKYLKCHKTDLINEYLFDICMMKGIYHKRNKHLFSTLY